MKTHSQIIDLWPNRAEFARDMSVGYQTATGWDRRNSIPPDYWGTLVKAAKRRGFCGVSVDLMASIRAGERAGSEAAA